MYIASYLKLEIMERIFYTKEEFASIYEKMVNILTFTDKIDWDIIMIIMNIVDFLEENGYSFVISSVGSYIHEVKIMSGGCDVINPVHCDSRKIALIDALLAFNKSLKN